MIIKNQIRHTVEKTINFDWQIPTIFNDSGIKLPDGELFGIHTKYTYGKLIVKPLNHWLIRQDCLMLMSEGSTNSNHDTTMLINY